MSVTHVASEQWRATPWRRRIVVLLLGVAALAGLGMGVVIWQPWAGADGGSSPRAGTGRSGPTAVASSDLVALAGSLGRPVYWAGPAEGFTYELTQTTDGRVYVRYLPTGVQVGDARSSFLTVGTYPVANAFGSLQALAETDGAASFKLPGGGLGVYLAQRPQSVYLAFPGSAVQVEVYDPSAERARALVRAGLVFPARDVAGAVAATSADLAALGDSLGRPVFWAGSAEGFTYELTQTTDGRVYVHDDGRHRRALIVRIHAGIGMTADAEGMVAVVGADPL